MPPPSCPSGFDAIDTASGRVCALRDHAPCLGGVVDVLGRFVCTDLDFECPPGMSPRRGAPPNWCFEENADVPVRTGLDWPSWPSWSWPTASDVEGYLGELERGVLTAAPVLVPPLGAYELGRRTGEVVTPSARAATEYGKDLLTRAATSAAQAAAKAAFPGGAGSVPVSVPQAAEFERELRTSSEEVSRGAKAAAAILGVAILGASLVWVFGKKEAPAHV